MAVALLARGTGSLPEADAPAPESPAYAYTPALKMRKYKLDNAFYLGNDGEVTVELSAERRNMIKSAIMDFDSVRSDFPTMRTDSGVYLDSSCQSLRPDSVIDAITEYSLRPIKSRIVWIP